MKKTVLIVGQGSIVGRAKALLSAMDAPDIELVTHEEGEIKSMPSMKLETPILILPRLISTSFKTGREKRRLRRKKNRN